MSEEEFDAHLKDAAIVRNGQKIASVRHNAQFLVDLATEWEVGEAGYESRSENCCFAGRRLTGKVLLTVAAGGVAFRERTFAAV